MLHANLADLQSARRRPASALEHAQLAVTTMEGMLGDAHAALVAPLGVLALTLVHNGRAEDAEVVARRGFEISTDQLGAGHPLTRAAAKDVEAIARGTLDEPPRVPESLDEELERLREIPDDRAAELLPDVSRLAEILRRLERLDDAECYLRRAAAQGRRLFKQPSETLGYIYGILGIVKREQDEAREAVEWLDESLHEFEELDNRAEMARTLTNLGNALFDVKEFGRAIEVQEHAAALAGEVFGPDDDVTVRYLNNLAVSLAEAGEAARLASVVQRVNEYRRGGAP
jgi:tetratricopeptide (TPR) repeat protein